MGASHLQGDQPQHALITSITPRSNGRKIRVRCRCMAEYRNVSRRYFNYDWIADVPADQSHLIQQRYEDHVRAATILQAVHDFHRKTGQV